MQKFFARNVIVHDGRFRQMHDRDHSSQMMRKKAAILGPDGAEDDIARSFGGLDASVDFIEAATELRIEKVAREIAVFEATVQDQPVPSLPADRIVRFAHRDAAHDVINDVDERGSGGFERRKFLQRGVAALSAEILNFGVKGIFARKMFVKERLGDTGGFGQLARRRVGKTASSKNRKNSFDDGCSSFLGRHALRLGHGLKLAFTYALSKTNVKP